MIHRLHIGDRRLIGADGSVPSAPEFLEVRAAVPAVFVDRLAAL